MARRGYVQLVNGFYDNDKIRDLVRMGHADSVGIFCMGPLVVRRQAHGRLHITTRLAVEHRSHTGTGAGARGRRHVRGGR